MSFIPVIIVTDADDPNGTFVEYPAATGEKAAHEFAADVVRNGGTPYFCECRDRAAYEYVVSQIVRAAIPENVLIRRG